MKRVLLTGISGSIGIHVYGHIMTNTDWEVVGIVSFRNRGLADRITEDWKGHPERIERTTIITHDLTAPISEMTRNKIGKIDYVIHLASLSDVEASIKNPVPFAEKNVSSTLNVLEYAREAKPEKFIMFSTDEVYGPTTGKNDGYVEWSPMVPSNIYAASKAAQEEFAIAYWASYSLPLIITNTMNNFGEMQSSTKYPVMIQKALSEDREVEIHQQHGQFGSRSYIHSRNLADALLFILKNCVPYLHEPGKVDKPDKYHIAGDRQLDNLELAQLIAKLMGKELKYKVTDVHTYRPGHDPHYGLNDDKLRNLGWKSPVSFEDSLAATIKWQSENPHWIT